MKLDGEQFQNSPNCKGTAYTIPGMGHDIASINISGRYPASGWAVNHEVHETVYVMKGLGELAFRDGDTMQLGTGDVVMVLPEVPFAWSGTMELVMVCEPAFTPRQHEIIGGDNG